MSFINFDLILGMDWLIEHGVILNYRKRKFLVQSFDGNTIEVDGVRMSSSTRIILVIRANKLFNEGCEDFLAYVINFNPGDS